MKKISVSTIDSIISTVGRVILYTFVAVVIGTALGVLSLLFNLLIEGVVL
mgnify:CR=1 FL=1